MAKRGKTVRRGRGRGRTQRRGRTQKRGRTQRRGRTYRQRGGVDPPETLLQRLSRENMEKIEANAKKNFFGVELNGENLYEEYKNLKKRGFDSDAAYNDIAARIGDYQNKEVIRPKLETLTREQIQKLNMAEREAEASRRAEMIARREEKRMSLAASPNSPPIYIPSQYSPVPSAPPFEVEDEPSAPPLKVEDDLFKPLKIEPLNTSKAPMSTRQKAIEYMKELNLTGERSAKFTQKFRELGSNEDALERIKRDTFFIENLKKDENAQKKVLKVMDDIAEDKAIEFMKEFNLTDTKRYEFMKRFRQLGSNEQAIETIMNDRDFFRSLTDISSRDNRPVSLKSVPYQYEDSSVLQHYGIV